MPHKKHQTKDIRYQRAAAIKQWSVVTRPNPLTSLDQLRIEVEYANGGKRLLAPGFRDRAALDLYIARFLPSYIGKEYVSHKSYVLRHLPVLLTVLANLSA